MNEELMSFESDEKKIKEDQEKRESNRDLVKKTQEITGAEKERLLLEQKEKDQLLKQQFSQFA